MDRLPRRQASFVACAVDARIHVLRRTKGKEDLSRSAASSHGNDDDGEAATRHSYDEMLDGIVCRVHAIPSLVQPFRRSLAKFFWLV